MSRPPIKAMKAVQRYCAKQKSCEHCVLHTLTEYGYSRCFYSPANWEIEKVETTIGCLKRGEKFTYEGRAYKVGNIINGTNGYVACVNVETHKVTRLYIDTMVKKEGGEK